MRLFRWIFVVSLLLVSSGVRAQTRLTRNGKPAARIVVAQQTAADLTAAQVAAAIRPRIDRCDTAPAA